MNFNRSHAIVFIVYLLIATQMLALQTGEIKIAFSVSHEREKLQKQIRDFFGQEAQDRPDVFQMVWDVVEATLDYFPNKQDLKVFTSVGSGDFGYERRILKALKIAGFTIETINLIDPLYERGFFKKQSIHFQRAAETIDLNIPLPTQKGKEALENFRKEFLECTINVFSITVQYTFACIDKKKFGFDTDTKDLRADLVWQSHFRFRGKCDTPDYKTSYMVPILNIRINAFKNNHPQYKNYNFDCISSINTKPRVLFLRNFAYAVIGHTLPEPDIDYMSFHNIAPWAGLRGSDDDLIKKVKDQVDSLSEDDPSKAMLKHYLNRFINRSNAAKQREKDAMQRIASDLDQLYADLLHLATAIT